MTALYRAYDANGHALYIGISKNWARRWVEHDRFSPWIYDVARLEVEWFPTKGEALRREAEAIKAEQPRWNWTHLRKNGVHASQSQGHAQDRLDHERAR